MAEKEERILITQWNINHDICLAPTEYQCGTSKSCDDCKVGMSRQEAIEKIAKAICRIDGDDCETCGFNGNEKGCKQYLEIGNYITMAEVALNELLESNDNEK